MDDAVKRLALALALLAGLPAAPAATLPDPTRPPAALLPVASGASLSGAAAAPVLQSVLVSPGGRQVAVIDGETVALGGSFRGAKLVRVSETDVQLQRGRERQILKLAAQGEPQHVPASKPAPSR